MDNVRVNEQFANVVFGMPLEAVTERELRALHGPAMERARQALHRALAMDRAADVVVSFIREAGKAAVNLVGTIGDAVACVMEAPLSVPACATRGIGARPAAAGAGPKRIEATRECDGTRLRILIEATEGRCDVRIRLEDVGSGKALAPMMLRVEDGESSKTLLDNKAFSSGEAVLRDVETGEYKIEAKSGGKSAGMTLKVQGATH